MVSSEVPAVPYPRSELGVTPQSLLDALPDATAVLDCAGTIIMVNRAWLDFGRDNGADPSSTGLRTNYLEVCGRASAQGCGDAVRVTAALRDVLDGGTVEASLDYPCASPASKRWFNVRMTPLDGQSPGAVVSHVNITRQKLAELDLERRASHDPLTDLANRDLFMERLEIALSHRSQHVGLVFLDLDDFKPINDTFGHHTGDEVLQVVAARLTSVIREHDTLARLGGDEFAIVAPDFTADGLSRLVARIRATLDEPHLLRGRNVQVSASIGATLAGHPSSAPELLRAADTEMYRDKHDRRRPVA